MKPGNLIPAVPPPKAPPLRTYSGPTLVRQIEAVPRHSLIVWSLLAAALLPRLLLLALNENLYGDAVIRTELGARWLENPRWIESFKDGAFQFGPLHLYLMGLALKIWPAREHAGRVLSLLFGVLTVVPLYSLTRRIFSWKAGVWACLGLSVWGLHAQLSSTAASESLGLLLVVTVLALFATGLERNQFFPITLAAVVLNLACATRYDAWMLGPILCLVLLLGDRDRVAAVARAVFFGLLCLPFPMAWMQGNEVATGNPFYPIQYIDDFHRVWFRDGVALWGEASYRLQNLFFWPGAALVSLTPLVALFGLAGMVRAWRERRDLRWLLWVVWVPTAYFSFRGLTRFAVCQIALLLPFAPFGFDWALGQASARLRRAALGLTVGVAVAFPIWLGAFTFHSEGKWQDSLRPLSPTSTNPRAVRQVARFLREQVAAAGEAVILDSDPAFRDLQVAFFSGLPEERIARYRWEIFPERLRTAAPRFLVRIDGGTLASHPHFELAGSRARLHDQWFEELPGFEPPFHVYRR